MDDILIAFLHDLTYYRVPFSVILGEDEVAAGKIKIKENGLREGHPEKTGVLVDMSELVPELRKRLARKAAIDGMTQEAGGLRVVGGIRGEAENQKPNPDAVEELATEPSAAALEAASPEVVKPTGEIPSSQEASGSVPAAP